VFAVLSVLLSVVLLSFGGVLSYTWLTVEIAWVFGAGLVLALTLVRQRSLSTPIVTFILASALIQIVLVPKLAIGFMAAAWAYLASRGGEAKVVRFFNFLVFAGILEALLGLFQYFVDPGWILGYQSPFYKVSGTLINRNHFAGLLEMLVPVAFGLAYSSARRSGDLARPYLYMLAGAFMGLALLFSTSRMGIFSFLVTAIFLAIVLQLRKYHGRTALALGFGTVSMVMAGALWIGIDSIVQRYSELSSEEAVLQEGRLIIYRDALRMIAANPGGVGSGNFRDGYREYQTWQLDELVDHAHNDYLETAAEWGLPVAAAFWSFLIFVVIRGVRLFVSVDSPEQRGILLACTGAIFSILVHSLADFNLQIPSNAMLFFTFVGISLALPLKEAKNA
jgi:putative inorganic carbon (hco3(-)) transporter